MSVFRVRTEGRRYNVTEDTINVKNIIVGFSFYKDSPTIIDVHIESHVRLPGGTSGVFSKDTRIDSQTYNAGNSYRITSTGVDTCTVSNITYTSPAAASSLSHTVDDTDLDDAFRVLNIPWNTTFLGRSYKGSEVFLCTNTYLTFGTGYSTITLSANDPPVPKLSIGNADNRMTLIKSDPPGITTILTGFDNVTKTFGDPPFTITEPTSDSPGEFTYSVISGTSVISMSGTTITILTAGTATVRATQAASGIYTSATKDATIQINQLAATLSASPNIFYRKFVSGASISFDVITSNAGTVARTHESSNTSIFSIPTASVPSGTIVAPGKIYINVTQPATTNYTAITTNQLITIIIVGSGITYSSETFPASFDLTGLNLSSSVFSNCNLTSANLTNANLTNSTFSNSTILTSANLFGATVNASTNLTTATLTTLRSGRIIGKTSLLPAGFTMI